MMFAPLGKSIHSTNVKSSIDLYNPTRQTYRGVMREVKHGGSLVDPPMKRQVSLGSEYSRQVFRLYSAVGTILRDG